MRPRSSLFSIAFITACSAGGPSNENPQGGKADDLDSSVVECNFSKELPFAHLFSGSIDSQTLATGIVGGSIVTPDDIDDLESIDSDQIFEAAVHLQLIDASEDFDAVFDVADDESFELLELEIEDLSGTTDFFFAGDWVRFFAGDTEVGVVFEADTTKIIAEISDGDVMSCVESQPAEPIACDGALLDNFTRDSTLHTVHIDDFEADATEMNLEVAIEAVGLVGAELGCEADDPAIEVDEDKAGCSELAEQAPWSTTCYVPTNAGFFLVSTDFVETVNVLFNRWD